MINTLINKMIEYNNGDPMRIQHLIKVHAFAELIGIGEQVNEIDQFILESAAVVHDIGIRKSEEVYGDSTGSHQEELGPDEAAKLLAELEYCETDIERICYLVGHHHTYNDIDGIDYQILVEADFLVNMYEDNMSDEAKRTALQKIFKTETGIKLCRTMYNL